MIKFLDGIHETVEYNSNSHITLYDNIEAEDYPPHWHIPFEIIMPIHSGYRAVCASQEYVLRERDVLIICPGILHELFAPEEGNRIIFQPSPSPVTIKEMDILTSHISPALLVTPEAFPEIHPRVCQLMMEIKEEFLQGSTYAETLIYAKFLEILGLVARSQEATILEKSEVKANKQKEYMDKFLVIGNYINEHFAEDITLEQMADMSGFSKYHFSRLFRQYMDTSFYKYLNQTRMSYAKYLLLDPQYSVLDVAVQSGYASLSAFLRMFKQINGCTPTEFRNMRVETWEEGE